MAQNMLRAEVSEAQERLDNTRHRPDPISDHWLGFTLCEKCHGVWRRWVFPFSRGCRYVRNLELAARAERNSARVTVADWADPFDEASRRPSPGSPRSRVAMPS